MASAPRSSSSPAGHRRIGLVLAGWLLAAGAQADPPLSAEAKTFIADGPTVVLHDCARPWPPRTCPQGRLLRAGEVEHFGEPASGDDYTSQGLEYDGMSFTWRRDEVVAMRVSGAAWPLPMRLRVGLPRSAFEHVLGKPTSQQQDARRVTIGYDDADTQSGVTLDVDRASGRVTRVSWSFYYD